MTLALYTYPLALNGVKVELLLAEADTACRVHHVDLPRREHLSDGCTARNPLGRLPFIDHDGFVLAESGAILRYLATLLGREDWYPVAPRERACVEQWMDFVAAHVNAALGALYVSRWFAMRHGWSMDLFGVERSLRDVARDLPILESQLSRTEYLAGPRPTLADLSLLPFLAVVELVGLRIRDPYPRLARWRDGMTARPSWTSLAGRWSGAAPVRARGSAR